MGEQARRTALGRLGLVLYWVGLGLAILFGLGALILGVAAMWFWINPHEITEPEILLILGASSAALAAISYGVGRAALFVFGNE
jgi:hypothetical protein